MRIARYAARRSPRPLLRLVRLPSLLPAGDGRYRTRRSTGLYGQVRSIGCCRANAQSRPGHCLREPLATRLIRFHRPFEIEVGESAMDTCGSKCGLVGFHEMGVCAVSEI